jgi:hypothetical protein
MGWMRINLQAYHMLLDIRVIIMCISITCMLRQGCGEMLSAGAVRCT